MKRALMALVPLLVMAPHMIPAPDVKVEGRQAPPARTLDDKERLPNGARMEQLARTDPVAFLQYCILRHDREVQGYTVTMQKQERLEGRLEKKEIVEAHYKVKPHSIFMRWREGERLAARALYVEGENDGQAVIKPAGLGGRFVSSVTRDPEGRDARKSGRYTLKEFGLRMALTRTLGSWQEAQKEGALHVEYGGKVKVKEAGDRECYKLHRTRFAKPEADGSTELTMYIDVETWLPLGTVLKGEDGRLIGEYYFRDLRLNPEFAKGQFTPAVVTAK
jgi:hypothetical protein